MPRVFTVLITFCLLIIAVFLVDELLRTPSHDRDWPEHYARTPNATTGTSSVTLYNVRNWNHSQTEILSQEWVDEIALNPESVTRVWFGVTSFGNQYMGHSYLSFELQDGSAYTFSIEARREVDEEYNVFLGLLNQYDLWYGWGVERDFLSASVLLLDRPLELYPLRLTAAQRAAVFRSMAAATADIAAKPRFYNTLRANCTNLLARAINDLAPGTLPYHLAWNLPGLAPQYLFDQGFIDTTETTLDPLRNRSVITDEAPGLLETTDDEPVVFSKVIRTALQAPSDE
jgi:hypothetical protein